MKRKTAMQIAIEDDARNLYVINHKPLTTNMKQKTAMQDVAEKLKQAKDNFPAIGFHDEFVRGFNKAFDMAILIVDKVGFQKQREQIEEAYVTGGSDGISFVEKTTASYSSASDYYQQKYGDEKTTL